MAVFTLDLTAEHRAKVEAYRVKHGLRSAAQAIRHMIEGATLGPGDWAPSSQQPFPKPPAIPGEPGYELSSVTAAKLAAGLRLKGFDPKTGEPIYG